MPYDLQGSLPAGAYALFVQGFETSGDGVMRAELVHRRGGADLATIASATTAVAQADVDGGFPGDYRATLDGAAIAADCGDQLVLRLTLLSGSAPYSNIEAVLTTP